MDSIPTASVTGQQDWEWNRLQNDRRARARPHDPEAPDSRHAASTTPPRRVSVPDGAGERGRRPVANLDREDRQLQAVITRYERILDERNREIAEATAEPTRTSRTHALVQAVRRFVAHW